MLTKKGCDYTSLFLTGGFKMKGQTIATITVKVKIDPDSKELKKQAKKAKQEERRLRAEVNRMVQQAKTQIKQLYRVYGIASPAVKALRERGTTLSVKGKNYQQLQSTYFSLEKFLKAKTSTVAGAEKVLQETAQIIGSEKIDAITIKDKAKEFFEIASKAQQLVESNNQVVPYTRIFNSIREIQQQANAKWKNAQSVEEKASIVSEKLSIKQREVLQDNAMAEYVGKIEKNIEGWLK